MENKKDLKNTPEKSAFARLLETAETKKNEEPKVELPDNSMDAVDVIEESNRKFRTDEINAYMATDNEFIVFLKNFVEMQKQKDDLKLHLKDQFFWLVMISFLVLIFAYY